MRAPLDGNALAAIVDSAGNSNYFAWALSNHDQPRLVSRWGRELAGVAAVFLLTLPGIACIYQGDEIGMIDGAGGPVVFDRSGRDAVRHPMQWTPDGGFTAGTPWLPMIDPDICNVADQTGIRDSMLETYRRLIGLRRQITGPVEVLFHDKHRLAFRRDSTIVELNLSDEPVEKITRDGVDIFRSGSGSGRVLDGRSAAIMVER
jgi:alpha-glucosidase